MASGGTVLFVILAASGLMLFLRQIAAQTTEITIRSVPSMPETGQVLICGAVVNPGYFPVKESDTLNGIIKSANPSPSADLSIVKIHVESVNHIPSPQKISLNRADVWLLSFLPGIGEGKAEAIARYRKNNGPFKHIDEVMNVEGIGAGTYAKIRDYITIED
jgi:competence protein ComEA